MSERETTIKPEAEYLSREYLVEKYNAVRKFTHALSEPLEIEDFVIQSMPDVSPAKWHLAHTSWFFEEFVLNKVNSNYESIHPKYSYLFNSYYVQAGERFDRPRRGLLSRPTVKDIFDYRRHVDEYMNDFLRKTTDDKLKEFAEVVEIGLNHEQQHQELFLYDIKHVFSINPLYPVYAKKYPEIVENIPEQKFIEFEEGVFKIGNDEDSFGYDNEFPIHKEYIHPFSLSNRLVTNGEFIEFIEDDGYRRPELWLSDGIAAVEEKGWKAPMYWMKEDGEWWIFTLTGRHKVNENEPVIHVSHYEADAFARWKNARLPTEAEWEIAADKIPVEGNFVDDANFHPVPLVEDTKDKALRLNQIYGDVWEWTQSAYLPYPGYNPPEGAIGEYNGKFMSNQIVLKGGSCATAKNHIRKTYRNFFYPHNRWQFAGLRLAKNL